MKKEWIRNLIALAVLGGMVFYVSFQRKKNFETTEKTDQEKKLVQLNWASIDQMDIKNLTGKISFSKRPKDDKGNLNEEVDSVSDWMISEPFKAIPESQFVQTLIDNVKDVTSTKVVDEKGSTPEQYQLKNPSIEIDLFEKNKPTPKFILKIGDSNSAKTGLYAQTSESPKIHLIAMALEYLKTRKPSDWRTKEIIGFKDAQKVKKIEIENFEKKETLQLVREGNDWNIEKPNALPADSNIVDNYLRDLRLSKATDVVSDTADQEQGKYNFQSPIAKIVYTTDMGKGDQKTQTLLFSKKGKNEYFVRRLDGSQIFSIAEFTKNTFLKNVDQVVNKKPFSGEDSKITQLEIQKGKESFRLEKTGEQWSLQKPVTDLVDLTEVSSLVSKLTSLSAKTFILSPKESSDKLGEIKMKIGNIEKQITFYEAKPGKPIPGILNKPRMGFEFEKSDIDFIFNSSENLREKRLVPFETRELSSFKVRKGNVEIQVKKNSSKDKGLEWKLSSISGSDSQLKKKIESKDTLKRLVRNLEGLKLQSFLTEPVPQKNGDLLIELHPEKGNMQTWSVDSGFEGKFKVWSTQRKVVGEVSGIDIEDIQNLFVKDKPKG